jgi:hypothetical protein
VKDSKLNKVLEGYKPIPMKRLFYPRGMQLSEDFVNAFHREYDRLIGEGINPKTLVERFGKAMKFHVNDTRKYKLLDEEQAGLEEGKKHWQKKQGKAARRREDKDQTKQKEDPRPDSAGARHRMSRRTTPYPGDSGITQS